MTQTLRVVRLKRTWLLRSDTLRAVLARQVRRRDLPGAWAGFALSPAERRFALSLLERRPSLWLYRTHQRCFAGDFLVVDMASRVPEARSVWGVELKSSRPLSQGRGGVQLSRVHEALAAVAANDVVPRDTPVRVLCGGNQAVLDYFRATS